MKTTLTYLFGGAIFTFFVGFVNFKDNTEIKKATVKVWESPKEGVLEYSICKNQNSKINQILSIKQSDYNSEIQNAKQYIEQLKIIENDSLIRLSQNDLVE